MIMNEKQRTAGITSEAAVAKIGNRYDLVLVAANRYRELTQGHIAKVKQQHGAVITALQEIEQGMIGKHYLYREVERPRRRKKAKY